MIWLLIALRVGDWVTTWAGIKRYGFNEKNPTTRKLMERYGFIPGLIGPDLIVLAAFWWVLDRHPESWPLFALAAALWGWIIIKNIRAIRGA